MLTRYFGLEAKVLVLETKILVLEAKVFVLILFLETKVCVYYFTLCLIPEELEISNVICVVYY